MQICPGGKNGQQGKMLTYTINKGFQGCPKAGKHINGCATGEVINGREKKVSGSKGKINDVDGE